MFRRKQSRLKRRFDNREVFSLRALLRIYCAFFRVGALTFGGGYSIIPMLEKEAIDRYHWLTKEELLDFFAVSQCIPGIIASNMAIMVGNKARGVSGAVTAAFGVISPSILIIMIIAAFLKNFSHLAIVQNAFWGIRVVVAALIVSVIINMLKTGVIDKVTAAIFVAVFLCATLLPLSPIWYVVGAALCGLIVSRIRKGRKGK